MASESRNPGPESVKPVNGNGHDVNGTIGNESSEKPLVAMLEPMREEQVQNAVKFLSHPRVRGSPIVYRRSFLEKKGLTKEEIDESFHRVPDPSPDVTKVEAATINQATQTKSSASVQPQATTQTQQPAASMVPSLQPRFQWSHALFALGVLSASGAGTALLFKKTVVPRLKAWIRDVISEKNGKEKENESSPSLAEAAAAAAAKAAASAAAVVSKTSQELLDSRKEEKKYFEAFMSLIDIQVKEMKSMGESIRKLEMTREYSYSQGKQTEDYVQSPTRNGPTNNFWKTTNPNQSDAGLSPTFSKQAKLNGTPNTDFGAVRPSSSAASMESLTAPHQKSYMERGEKPTGIKDINDIPPNPNQTPSKSLLTPKPKPWEVAQQKPSYGEGFSYGLQDNGNGFQVNGKACDAPEPWWRKNAKITEIEPESEEQKQFSYQSERPSQRGWVPPEPPSVVMPEAAAAIRQPKPSVQMQLPVDKQTIVPSDGEEGAVRASDSVVEVETTGSPVVDINQAERQVEQSNGIEVN